MRPLIIYVNELSFAFEGLDVPGIKLHVQSAIRALYAASLLRGDMRVSLPQPLGQISLGQQQLILAAVLPGPNTDLSLLKRVVDRAPCVPVHAQNNEVQVEGRIAVGLSWAHREDSLGLSFGYAAPWDWREISAEWHVLNGNGNVTVSDVMVRNAAVPAHVEYWRQHIEEYGRDLAASSLVHECREFAARMFFDDHGYPHVHIYRQANDRALMAKVRIDNCDILEGAMAGPLRRAVFAMIEGNRAELWESWDRCRKGLHPFVV